MSFYLLGCLKATFDCSLFELVILIGFVALTESRNLRSERLK